MQSLRPCRVLNESRLLRHLRYDYRFAQLRWLFGGSVVQVNDWLVTLASITQLLAVLQHTGARLSFDRPFLKVTFLGLCSYRFRVGCS